jgi:hypothetical protein
MTQEQKDLLLKDLCARLPYGVKCIEKTPIEDFQDKNLWEIDRIRYDTNMFGMSNCYVCYGQYEDIHNIKPYLFPLSSMTEEQKYEFENTIVKDGILTVWTTWTYDWFNKNHFDYRGLIPMGLAEDATGLNIY